MLYIGNKNIGKTYVGSKEILYVYVGNKKIYENLISTPITWNASPGLVAWDSTVYTSFYKKLDKPIRPMNISLVASITGSGWVGVPHNKLYGLNVATGNYELIYDSTGTNNNVDVSTTTNGKKYSRLRADVGFASMENPSTITGSVSINTYKK